MLNRERDELMDTLTEQKAVLGQVRQREFEAYNQVKKSCHMVEQAQLEKAEVNGEMNGWIKMQFSLWGLSQVFSNVAMFWIDPQSHKVLEEKSDQQFFSRIVKIQRSWEIFAI